MPRPPIQDLRVTDLSLEEQVGQMLFARHHTLLDDPRYAPLLERGLIGGVQVAPGGAAPFSPALRARIDAAVGIPVLAGADAEEGGASVCPGGLPIPSAGALAALGCPDTARALGRIVGRQLMASGITMVFGPVLDVNRLPDGVMALRAYGSRMQEVERLGAATLEGYLASGLVASGKHYPGGSSHSAEDNHIVSDTVGQDLDQVRRWDLRAYRAAMRAGLNAVMTTHHPVREDGRCRPATFSRAAIGLLRAEGFDGLVISDSLAMAALRTQWTNAEILRQALAAGHDLLLVDYAQDPAEAYAMMLAAVRAGAVPADQVAASAARILRAKRRLAAAPTPVLSDDERAQAASAIRAAAARAVDWRAPAPLDPASVGLILWSRPAPPPVRNEVVLHSADRGFRGRLAALFPAAALREVSDWPVREIEGVLRTAAPVARVLVVAEAANCAYRGTVDYSEPFLALVRALRSKIAGFLHFGNPNAIRRLPAGLPNLIVAFSGATAEQAALDVLQHPDLPRGRFRLPDGRLDD